MAGQRFTTCLLFVGEQRGKAEEAMTLYTSLFDTSRIVEIERYGPGEEEQEGTIKRAVFSLDGQVFMALDSQREHHFAFTPAMSLFVECRSEEEIDRLYAVLTEGGDTPMPLGDYGFSQKFGWVQDRYGVSWQLNLANT